MDNIQVGWHLGCVNGFTIQLIPYIKVSINEKQVTDYDASSALKQVHFYNYSTLVHPCNYPAVPQLTF